MQRVRPLHHRHAFIVAQLPRQHAVPGVDGIDVFRPALQQTVREPADIAAEVGADHARYIELECIQRMGELSPGAGDEFFWGPHMWHTISVHAQVRIFSSATSGGGELS